MSEPIPSEYEGWWRIVETSQWVDRRAGGSPRGALHGLEGRTAPPPASGRLVASAALRGPVARYSRHS
jgi:hypothetical protein